MLEPRTGQDDLVGQGGPGDRFGIYFDESHSAFISHGELKIVRLSAAGQIVWSESGADIFSEGFALHPQFIEVIDFNGKIYRFRYEDGLSISL